MASNFFIDFLFFFLLCLKNVSFGIKFSHISFVSLWAIFKPWKASFCLSVGDSLQDFCGCFELNWCKDLVSFLSSFPMFDSISRLLHCKFLPCPCTMPQTLSSNSRNDWKRFFCSLYWFEIHFLMSHMEWFYQWYKSQTYQHIQPVGKSELDYPNQKRHQKFFFWFCNILICVCDIILIYFFGASR